MEDQPIEGNYLKTDNTPIIKEVYDIKAKLTPLKLNMNREPGDSISNNPLNSLKLGETWSNDYKKSSMSESVKATELYSTSNDGSYEANHTSYIPKTHNDTITETHQTVHYSVFIIFFILFLSVILVLFYNKKKKQIDNVNSRQIKNKNKTKFKTSKNNLSELKDKGIITEEEFQVKIKKIKEEKKIENLLNSTEYKQLKSLYDNGILTKEEFETKIILIK